MTKTKKTFAVMGATGHIGQTLTEELLKTGHKVRALGRNKGKLQKLKEKGAEVYAHPFDDVSALTSAFKDCYAVFTLIPPDYKADDYGAVQDKIGEATVDAILKARVQNVLNLSSIGADLVEGTGPIKGLHRQEERLNEITNLNVVNFRAGYFMENLFNFIPLIKTSGMTGSTLRPDLQIPMVATRDIGLKAAELLTTHTFRSHEVFEFIGPKTYTMAEATSIIGKAIRKPDMKYYQFTTEDAEKGMTVLGIKPSIIQLILEMNNAFNTGKIKLSQKITPEHQGKMTLEEFAKLIFSENYFLATKKAA